MAMPVPADVDALAHAVNTVASSLTPAAAARRVWDVLVIGAGPAGSLAARQLGRRGIATLLVDRARFPRDKVCGCCLSAAGLQELAGAGLDHLVHDLGAPPLRQLQVYAGGRHAAIDLPTGAAISRRRLDAALIREAIARGSEFVSEAAAQLDGIDGERRGVYLRSAGEYTRVAARIVLIADGLGGRVLVGERGFGRYTTGASRDRPPRCAATCPQRMDAAWSTWPALAAGMWAWYATRRAGWMLPAAFEPSFMREHGGGPGRCECSCRRAAWSRSPVCATATGTGRPG